MDITKEINDLKAKLNSLERAMLQSSRNNVTKVAKLDTTSNNLDTNINVVEKNTANIDYIAMMAGVEIPTEEV